MSGRLKSLRFKSVTARVLSVEHVSRVLVEWELERTSQNLLGAKFFVDRAESPNVWTELTPDGISVVALREFVDETANLLDFQKKYYYRVRLVEFSGSTPVQTFTSEPVTWDGDHDLVGLYVVEEHLFLYRHTSAGMPALIFKKMHDGEQCTACWDPVLKRVTKSNCTVCFGTGKVEGYYPPIAAWMGFEPEPKMSQVVDWGERQVNQTDVQFTNYPELRVGDVILEVKPHRFWRVSNVRYPQKNRVILLQTARLDAISTSDVEQRITVPAGLVEPLLLALEERRRETEF